MNNIENELRELYNKLEGEYKAIEKIASNPRDLEAHLGIKKLPYGIAKAFEDSFDFESFLQQCQANKVGMYEVADILIKRSYRRNEYKLKAVVALMRATEDATFIELADKLFEVKSKSSAEEIKEWRRAKFLLQDALERGTKMASNYPIRLSDKREFNGRVHTVKSEIGYINKTAKKIGREKKKLTSRYNNISNIDVRSLYSRISRSFHDKGIDISTLSETELRDIVISNRYNFISFLSKDEALSFATTQKLGKIR